jgi:hypothetical protein
LRGHTRERIQSQVQRIQKQRKTSQQKGKRQKVLDEEKEKELQEEVVPVDKEPIVVVEVSSSEKLNSTEGQNEIECLRLQINQSILILLINSGISEK